MASGLRWLKDGALLQLREDPKLVALLQFCRADLSLSIFLRGSTLDVYWEGFVVFHVSLASGTLQVGSAKIDKAGGDRPASLAALDPADIPRLVDWVKGRRAEKAAFGSPELRFETAIIRDNRALGSHVMVLDRQIAQPGVKGRLDLMLLDVGSSRLAVAELKVERNPDVRRPVLGQLQHYVDVFSNLAPDYAKVLSQMQLLGLVANRHATVNPNEKPLPVLLLAGLPVKKLGASKDSPRLYQLYEANKVLAADSNWDARMMVFPRHDQQSFSIPIPLDHLPTIDAWCSRYLS